MLLAVDLGDWQPTSHDAEADADVVANAELIVEPSCARELLIWLRVMTGHHALTSDRDRFKALLDRVAEPSMELHAIVRDIPVWNATHSPGTTSALRDCLGRVHNSPAI
jgi:hypothetical protein